MKKILVIDVGGSNVKMMISAEEKRRKFPSGPKLGPEEAVAQIKQATRDWEFEAISIGFPAPVREGKILHDPKHLGKNWAEFDFAKALGKPALEVGRILGRAREHLQQKLTDNGYGLKRAA